jgi:peptidyl-prolyl cis-trans isomerase C
MAPDTVLADNGVATITRAEYDLELTKLPPQARGGFATSEKRVVELINRMLVTKTLARQAEQAKLLDDPEISARLAMEFDRIKSQLMVQKIERDAAAAFDANLAAYEARARDLYAVTPRKWDLAGEVSASHILFAMPPYSLDEAMRLAQETRAALVAGGDFEAAAREKSGDPSAKVNGGKLGFFQRGQMDGQFEAAAFAMTNVGEISQPVVSSFGVHLIRLDAVREGRRQTFEQARPRILAELRASYINAEKEAVLDKLRLEAAKSTDPEKVKAIVVPAESIGDVRRDAQQRQREMLQERARQLPK